MKNVSRLLLAVKQEKLHLILKDVWKEMCFIGQQMTHFTKHFFFLHFLHQFSSSR